MHDMQLWFIIYIMNKQATGRVWPLYSFQGFLPFIRNIVKITKVTDINKNMIEENKSDKERAGTATPAGTPCLSKAT